jgi:hypothetical protein
MRQPGDQTNAQRTAHFERVWPMHRGRVPSLLMGVVLTWLSFPAGAEPAQPPTKTDPPPAESQPEPETRTLNVPSTTGAGDGSPGLDVLLQLPTGYGGSSPNAGTPSVAGASEVEWRRRFREAREALSEARLALEATKRELDGAAGDSGSAQWSMTPPSAGGDGPSASQSGSPLSFKLRQQLKQNREALDQAERALRELDIEANLAGVPQPWRGEDRKPESSALPEVGRPAD